jgi:DNA-binding response OmpR family regulator
MSSLKLQPLLPLVLVIEDEPQVRRFLRTTLPAQGYRLVEALSGGQGLLEAAARRPDLVILDLVLPDLDGAEVIERLREWSQVPIVVVSVRGREMDKVHALEAGADDYLTKPFDFAELLVRIKAQLRRAPVERHDVLRVADLEMDRAAQRVRRGGRLIELTAKEYALLEYLMCSPERVFSRTMILNHVWDQSFEGVTNIVDVYVRYLRKKVDEPFALKLIHTVRGVGYCIRGAEPRPDAALE